MTSDYFSTVTDFDTSYAGDEPAETLAQRLGRCYQLAGYALTIGSAPDTAILVHGTVRSTLPGIQRIGHAWLELSDGTVWEPISRQIWHIDAWQAFAHAVSGQRYTHDEVLRIIVQQCHWGPWTDDIDDMFSEDDK